MNRREMLASLMALPVVASVARADVGLKDVIVIRTSDHVDAAQVEIIRHAMKSIWPDNKCAVLGPGMSIEIVRQL